MTTGCFLFYISDNYLIIIVMIFIIGVGVTAIQTSANLIIRLLDIPKRYTANLTMVAGIGALGFAFSPLLVPFIQIIGFSWNCVYLIFGIFDAIILFLLFLGKFPTTTINVKHKTQIPTIFKLLKNPIIITYSLGLFLYVGAEVGTSSYIVLFMEKVHGVSPYESLWDKETILFTIFPSISALVVSMFWLLQALGRLINGLMMKDRSAKKIFIFHSIGVVIVLLIAIFGSKTISLISFAISGYFTSALFQAIFSSTIQSFNKNYGIISGILCTMIVGGSIIGFLVGLFGDLFNMKIAMFINVIAFPYIFLLAIWGHGKLDII